MLFHILYVLKIGDLNIYLKSTEIYFAEAISSSDPGEVFAIIKIKISREYIDIIKECIDYFSK